MVQGRRRRRLVGGYTGGGDQGRGARTPGKGGVPGAATGSNADKSDAAKRKGDTSLLMKFDAGKFVIYPHKGVTLMFWDALIMS